MIKLRTYQENQIKAIKSAWRQGSRRIIIQLATGGGKTVIFTFIAKLTLQSNNNALIITDRKELLKQTGNTFSNFGLKAVFLDSKQKTIPFGSLVVGMSETIKRRLKKSDYVDFVQSFKLIVIDEAHKRSFDKIFDHLTPDQYVIGATATPIRIGQKDPLINYYQEIIQGVEISELIRLGFLSKARYFGISLDFSNVKLKAGEFDSGELQKYYDQNMVFKGVVQNYLRHANGTKAILFAPNVKASKQMQSEFENAGISSGHIDASSSDRDQILLDFKNNCFKVLCSVDILTTGYDEPTIQTVILYRATMSLTLYLQMVGRGSRTCEGKNTFTVLDFGGNIQRHDFWHSSRSWSLDPPEKNKKNGTKLVKTCPNCEALIPASARACEFCGFVFPVTKKEAIEIILTELSDEQIKEKYTTFDIEEKEIYRELKGYKQGWLFRQFTSIDDFKNYAKLKGYKNNWAWFQASRYLTK